jgi:hypothetical protein
MRASTGRLSVILTGNREIDRDGFYLSYRRVAYLNLFEPHHDSTFIDSIPLDRYDAICQRHGRFTSMPESLSMTVGSIIWGPHSSAIPGSATYLYVDLRIPIGPVFPV